MAVRLLAGPFPLKSETGEVTSTMKVIGWYPGVGLLTYGYFPSFMSDQVCVGTLDGVCIPRAMFLYPASWSWWPEQKRIVGFTGGKEHLMDPISFAIQHTSPLDQPTNFADYRRYVKLPDRRIYFRDGRVYRQVQGVPIDVPESVVFTPLFPGAEVFPGRHRMDVFVGDSYYNQACFYNTISQKMSSPVYYIGMACDELIYAPEYGVMVSSHKEVLPEHPDKTLSTIRVWSLEVEPTQLTPVVAIGSTKSGSVMTYRVQLLGAQDEPAPEEAVNWTLTGAGQLLQHQSETDDEGFATTQVQYQLAETGPSVVDASVTC